jgi:hypothetical protein
MSREIKLDGGEITVLKTLGLSGTQLQGEILMERMEGMEVAEVLDTINGLIALGYVLSSKVNLRTADDVQRALLRVNPSYSRELKEALNPSRGRDERRSGRERR